MCANRKKNDSPFSNWVIQERDGSGAKGPFSEVHTEKTYQEAQYQIGLGNDIESDIPPMSKSFAKDIGCLGED